MEGDRLPLLPANRSTDVDSSLETSCAQGSELRSTILSAGQAVWGPGRECEAKTVPTSALLQPLEQARHHYLGPGCALKWRLSANMPPSCLLNLLCFFLLPVLTSRSCLKPSRIWLNPASQAPRCLSTDYSHLKTSLFSLLPTMSITSRVSFLLPKWPITTLCWLQTTHMNFLLIL